jgi:hypothetical protein
MDDVKPVDYENGHGCFFPPPELISLWEKEVGLDGRNKPCGHRHRVSQR